MISKINIHFLYSVHNHEKEFTPANMEEEKSFDNLINYIDEIVSKWYWYDKKMWEIYFHRNMSMREINRRTKISLSSIFETLNYAKKEIKKSLKKMLRHFCGYSLGRKRRRT